MDFLRKHKRWNMAKRVVKGLLIVVGLVAIISLGIFTVSALNSAPLAAPSIERGRTAVPAQVDIPAAVEVRALAVPHRSFELHFPANGSAAQGVVTEVLVQEGGVVQQGDILARLDTREL